MSAQEPTPELSHLDWEEAGFDLALPGFWLCASGVSPEPADQTFETLCEAARFYPAVLPAALRSRLRALDEIGPGREEPFRQSFREAYASLAGRHDGVKGIARRRARFEAAGGFADGDLRELASLSFSHFRHEEDKHWGALLVTFDASLFLASGHDRICKVSPLTQDRCVEGCFDLSLALVESLESRWGLPPAMASHRRAEARIHWMKAWPPSAMDEESDAEALRALAAFDEARQIEGAAEPARAPSAPRSL